MPNADLLPNAIGTHEFGLSFDAEFAAAGFEGLWVTHGNDGQHTWREGVTAAQKGAVAAFVAAHDPRRSDLRSYAEYKQDIVANGGIQVNVSAGIVDVASNDKGRGLVNGRVSLYQLAVAAGQPTPPSKWVNNDGTTVLITVTDAVAIGVALGAFIQATYDVLGDALKAIDTGTIKDKAGVDALPWPLNA